LPWHPGGAVASPQAVTGIFHAGSVVVAPR
jgi:hypothetical protein